jgi:hypothetical protein
LLGQDQIVGSGNGSQNYRGAMLRPVGDHDPFRIYLQTSPFHPRGARPAVPVHAMRRLVDIEELMQVTPLRQQLQSLPQDGIVRRPHQPASTEIDEIGSPGFIGSFPIGGFAWLNKCSSADFSPDNPPLLRDGVRAADGSDGDLKAAGELPLGGQPGAWRESAGEHIPVERFDQRDVFGLVVRRQLRRPDCHYDNL